MIELFDLNYLHFFELNIFFIESFKLGFKFSTLKRMMSFNYFFKYFFDLTFLFIKTQSLIIFVLKSC